jgi:hypothetical protein
MRKNKPQNLNEELNRMRRLMDFSINEHSHDVLAEQVSQTAESYTELLMPTEEEESKFKGANIIGKLRNYAKNQGDGEENAINRHDELFKQYGDNYSKFIQALANYPANKNNWMYWHFRLTQDTRKEFLNEFVNWLNSGDRNIKKIAQTPELESNKGSKITARIERGSISVDVEKGEIPAPPPQPFMFDMQGNNTFIDNKSDISSEMQVRIDDFIKKITPRIQKTLQNKKGVVTCDKIDIAASSSRFRNTNEAKNLTWAQLSEQRANKVYEEIYNRLAELGVKFKNNHKVLRGGLNGDGSSGPNPGKNDKGQQYTISRDGSYNNVLSKNEYTPENINKLGDPHATKQDYDKYKFCIVEVVVSGLYVEDPDPYTEITKSREWSIEFKVSDKMGQPRKLGKFNTPIWTIPKSKGTPNLTKCPKFSGGENYGIK